MKWSSIRHGWKTILGAVVTGFGAVSDPAVLGYLPHKAASVVTVIGAVLTAIGIRHAVGKVAAPKKE